ncbi:hypothetical protein H4R20_004845 [Coemansia guatemalensis]|uniref:FAR1 domain-containing protein n=1 Tax=Coemansia guatemalensis TaxID=2761395 RepID=A0A9W8LQ57_9FUNG|nr:hypothetical protein H4R20_004845 [Coemansia guatemalensis]
MSAEKCTLIPEQLFDSQDAFISHVKRFAVENGFNVRLDDVERDKGGVIRKRDIVCSSEGAPRGKDAKREDSAGRSDAENSEVMSPGKSAVAHSGAHRRKSMKTGCRWLARASRQQSGMWKIIMLRLEHNHPLATRYELMMPTAHNIRTGDNASISAAAIAARTAVENGTYTGPSSEFKNLFLQMSAACDDLCWSAARHPETVPEVLSEIRRLNQHLDKHGGSVSVDDSGSGSTGMSLPTIAEDRSVADAETTDAARALDTNGTLVMMGRGTSAAGGRGMVDSPLQASRMIETPAQIIAQSQNRNIEPQSPELNAADNAPPTAVSAAAETSPAVSASQSSAAPGGPVKRSRGRPRKNPVGADGKPTKSRAQQKREQQRVQQQQLTQAQITPTPASLASLSQQIISQNAAPSPASVQRPLNSSLALPSQPIQSHVHQGGRTQIIGTDASIPSMLDARSHLSSVQRQQQQPQPQPQQSPTFFLGAAEGNGYSEHPAAAAADPKSAALGTPTPATAAAADASSDVAANVGYAAPNIAQKPSAIRPAIAPAPATDVPQYAAASAAANASSATNTIWRDGLLSPARPTDTGVSPAAAAVPRPAAVSAISDPAPNAASAVGAVGQPATGPAAVDDRDHHLSLDAASGVRHDGQYAVDSPQLSVAGSISSVHNQAPAFPSYHSHPPPTGYHYAHPAYREQQQQQLHRQQQRQTASMGSGMQPPTSAMGHLVLSSNSAVTSAAGYHGQIARMHQDHSSPISADPAANQRAPLLSLSQTMQVAQQSRGQAPAAAQINPYFIMPRPQQQQQQQIPQSHLQPQKQQQQYQQPADHLVGVPHQSPATMSALPPMQNPMISESGRRFDELQLNTYQGMGNWQI